MEVEIGYWNWELHGIYHMYILLQFVLREVLENLPADVPDFQFVTLWLSFARNTKQITSYPDQAL